MIWLPTPGMPWWLLLGYPVGILLGGGVYVAGYTVIDKLRRHR